MRISVVRSGGVTGLRRHGFVDTDTREDRSERHGQADAALAELAHRTPAITTPPSGADRRTYVLDIDGHRTEVGEHALTGALRDLVDRVLDVGAAGGGLSPRPP